jgi:general stress protein YciG
MQMDVQVSDLAREVDYSDDVRRRAGTVDKVPVTRRARNGSSIHKQGGIQKHGQPSILASTPRQELAITVREAGRKGGLSCLRNRGRQFFSEIGRTGQQAIRRKYPGMASEWGRRGGRPRKRGLADIVGEAKK